MKKKIKDLTIEEFISLARKTKDSLDGDFCSCNKCPLNEVEELECWKYCFQGEIRRRKIDNILNQEIEVEEDE